MKQRRTPKPVRTFQREHLLPLPWIKPWPSRYIDWAIAALKYDATEMTACIKQRRSLLWQCTGDVAIRPNRNREYSTVKHTMAFSFLILTHHLWHSYFLLRRLKLSWTSIFMISNFRDCFQRTYTKLRGWRFRFSPLSCYYARHCQLWLPLKSNASVRYAMRLFQSLVTFCNHRQCLCFITNSHELYLTFYYWYFKRSCNRTGVFNWKWASMFVTVLPVPSNHEHREYRIQYTLLVVPLINP